MNNHSQAVRSSRTGWRPFVRTTAGITVLSLLSGCWLQVNSGPGQIRFNALEDQLTKDNVESLSEDWSVTHGGVFSEPMVVGNQIYTTVTDVDSAFQDTNVAVWSLEGDSGDVLWQQSLVPDNFDGEASATPAVYLDKALWVSYRHDALPECSGRLARLDPITGDVITDVGTGQIKSPVVAAGSFVAYTESTDCSMTDQLVLRDMKSQDIVWTRRFDSQLSHPTIADGNILVLADSDLYAFDMAGCSESGECEPRWILENDNGSLGGQPIGGPDGLIFIGHTYTSSVDEGEWDQWGRLVAIDSLTGEVLWHTAEEKVDNGGLYSVAVGHDVLYIFNSSSADDNMESLDAYSATGCGATECEPSWTLTPDLEFDGPPTVAGGVVYVPLGSSRFIGTDNALLAIDAHGCGKPACDEISSLSLSGSFRNMSVAHGRVFMTKTTSILPPETTLTAFSPA